MKKNKTELKTQTTDKVQVNNYRIIFILEEKNEKEKDNFTKIFTLLKKYCNDLIEEKTFNFIPQSKIKNHIKVKKVQYFIYLFNTLAEKIQPLRRNLLLFSFLIHFDLFKRKKNENFLFLKYEEIKNQNPFKQRFLNLYKKEKSFKKK